MIALLRSGALLANVAILAGAPLLFGATLPWAICTTVCGFALAWWGTGRVPQGETASPEAVEAASRAARRLGARAPRWVLEVEGWTAGAVRAKGGYGLLVGAEVAPEHRERVLAHEIAHHVTGDLWWEPFTDGPARLLLQWMASVPPLVVILFPFLLLGAPLARATELRADRLAGQAYPGYSGFLREVADRVGSPSTILYPSLGARVRHSARISK